MGVRVRKAVLSCWKILKTELACLIDSWIKIFWIRKAELYFLARSAQWSIEIKVIFVHNVFFDDFLLRA